MSWFKLHPFVHLLVTYVFCLSMTKMQNFGCLLKNNDSKTFASTMVFQIIFHLVKVALLLTQLFQPIFIGAKGYENETP